jgi:hypothetical protein
VGEKFLVFRVSRENDDDDEEIYAALPMSIEVGVLLGTLRRAVRLVRSAMQVTCIELASRSLRRRAAVATVTTGCHGFRRCASRILTA